MKIIEEIVEDFVSKFSSIEDEDYLEGCLTSDACDWLRTTLTSRDTYWKERVRKIKEKVERVRLDVDVIKCDCGEPYKDSDLDLSVGELEQALDTLLDNLK